MENSVRSLKMRQGRWSQINSVVRRSLCITSHSGRRVLNRQKFGDTFCMWPNQFNRYSRQLVSQTSDYWILASGMFTVIKTNHVQGMTALEKHEWSKQRFNNVEQ